MIKGYLECITEKFESHSSKYDNFVLGNLNSEPTEEAKKPFTKYII